MIDKLLMTLIFLLVDEALPLPLVKEFDRGGWRGEAPWG